MSPGVGSTHLHCQALKQGSVALTGRPCLPGSCLAGELLEDSAGLGCPRPSGFADHGQERDSQGLALSGSVQVGPLGLGVRDGGVQGLTSGNADCGGLVGGCDGEVKGGRESAIRACLLLFIRVLLCV